MRGEAVSAPVAKWEPQPQLPVEMGPRRRVRRSRIEPQRRVVPVPEVPHSGQARRERRAPGGPGGEQWHGPRKRFLRHETEQQIHMRRPPPYLRIVFPADVLNRLPELARRQPRHRRPGRWCHLESIYRLGPTEIRIPVHMAMVPNRARKTVQRGPQGVDVIGTEDP